MPKVVTEELPSQQLRLTVTIEKKDYEARFREELKKYRKEGNFRGFRKGKVPESWLRKAFGKNVLAEVVTDLLEREVDLFIENDDKHIYVGRPLPVEGSDKPDFDARELKNYVFRFDLGVVPAFEVQGLSKETVVEYFVPQISEERLEKEWNTLLKEHGEQVDLDAIEEEECFFSLRLQELEGDVIKEGGVDVTRTFGPSAFTEEWKNILLGKRKGDSFIIEPFEALPHEEKLTKRYILGVNEDAEVGDRFLAQITQIKRSLPAEPNEDFFKKAFPNKEVKDTAEALDAVREMLRQSRQSESDFLFARDLRKKLVEANRAHLELPREYLHRFMKDQVGDDFFDIGSERFERFEEDIRWDVLSNRIAKQFALEVENEEILQAAQQEVVSYLVRNNYPPERELILKITRQLISVPSEVNRLRERILEGKIIDKLKEVITIEEKEVPEETFDDMVRQAKEEDSPKARAEEEEE